jgi:transcriptional regulator with XRE-family HTH domain
VDAAEPSGRKRFSAELKAQRHAKGWTQVELGEKLGYSGSFVSDVERADRSPSEDFAKRCDDTFGLPGTFVRHWEDLQREVFPTWFAPITPIEREADKITGWELGAVPGLLQTEDYARALIKAGRPHDGEEAIERIVRGRIDRQAVMARPKPPKLTYVIHEGVLRHVVGSREVMADQLDSLVKVAEEPGVVIQALPFSAHDFAGAEGLLYIYERLGQPTVVYTECFGGARIIEILQEVSDLVTVMGMLRAAALPPRDSVELMRAIRRELD